MDDDLLKEFERQKKHAVQPVMFEAGAGLMDCQSLEYALKYFLYLLARSGLPGLDINRIEDYLDEKTKITAGQLVNLLQRHFPITAGSEAVLSKALVSRNSLVHTYFAMNIERLADRDQHISLAKEIRALRRDVQKANQLLDGLIRQLAKLFDDTDVDQIEREMKEEFLRQAKPDEEGLQ